MGVISDTIQVCFPDIWLKEQKHSFYLKRLSCSAKKGSERAALGSFGRQGARLAAQLGAVNQKQTEEQRSQKWKEKKHAPKTSDSSD